MKSRWTSVLFLFILLLNISKWINGILEMKRNQELKDVVWFHLLCLCLLYSVCEIWKSVSHVLICQLLQNQRFHWLIQSTFCTVKTTWPQSSDELACCYPLLPTSSHRHISPGGQVMSRGTKEAAPLISLPLLQLLRNLTLSYDEYSSRIMIPVNPKKLLSNIRFLELLLFGLRASNTAFL